MQPVFKQVEKLKIELAREEADGWVLAVLKSAFIQGSNSDFSIDDLATNNGHNVKYDNLVDKLYIRRMPEILRTHIFPRFEKTYLLKDIIKASDEEGVFLDSEAPGDCKIVYDEFLKIVSNLRVKEKEGGGGGMRKREKINFLGLICGISNLLIGQHECEPGVATSPARYSGPPPPLLPQLLLFSPQPANSWSSDKRSSHPTTHFPP